MKKILGFFFFIIALCSLIIGISCFSMYVGSPHNFHEYGGDAYTGIQHATAQTANNIVLLNKIVTKVSGWFFILVSLVLSSIGFYFFFAPNVNTSPLSISNKEATTKKEEHEKSKEAENKKKKEKKEQRAKEKPVQVPDEMDEEARENFMKEISSVSDDDLLLIYTDQKDLYSKEEMAIIRDRLLSKGTIKDNE